MPQNDTTNNQTTTPEVTDIQPAASAAIENARNDAKSHYNQAPINPTYEAMHADGMRAAEIAQNLQQKLSENQTDAPVKETMQQDNTNAARTLDNIQNGAEPLAAYTDYATVAVPQQSTESNRTYDRYVVSEEKNNLNVEYNLTDVRFGHQAAATNNPNSVTGTSISEQNYSYNEKTLSNGKTVITTTHTTSGINTPGSEHYAMNQTENAEFKNTQQSEYTYDKNKKLINEQHHSESSRTLSDRSFNEHEATEISTSLNGRTTFNHIKFTNGEQSASLTGSISSRNETYSSKEKNGRLTEVTRRLNNKNEYEYIGTTQPTDDKSSLTPLTSRQAEQKFNQYQKEVNRQTRELTGAENLEAYAKRLGEKKPSSFSLDAAFNNNSSNKDRENAEAANKKVEKQFEGMPAVLIATKNQGR